VNFVGPGRPVERKGGAGPKAAPAGEAREHPPHGAGATGAERELARRERSRRSDRETDPGAEGAPAPRGGLRDRAPPHPRERGRLAADMLTGRSNTYTMSWQQKEARSAGV